MIGPDRGQDSAATVDRKGCRRSIELTEDRICRGSLQNKPAANGSCGGPAVGTGKQRKQQEIVAAKARAEAKVVKEKKDAEKKAFRENA